MGVRDTGRLDTEIIKKGESWSERKRVKKTGLFSERHYRLSERR